MTGATNIEPTPEVWTIIWIANGLLVLLVVALVVTEAMLLIQSRFLGQAGSGLQLRMVAMFAAAAAVPAIIVAVVATISLNQGLDQWFSERTKTMVEASRLVARSYMLEHAQVLRDDIIWTAGELEQARATFETDRVQYQRILTALAVTRSLPFATLVSSDGDTLMRAQINAQNVSPQLPDGLIQHVDRGCADADLARRHAARRRRRQAARLRRHLSVRGAAGERRSARVHAADRRERHRVPPVRVQPAGVPDHLHHHVSRPRARAAAGRAVDRHRTRQPLRRPDPQSDDRIEPRVGRRSRRAGAGAAGQGRSARSVATASTP